MNISSCLIAAHRGARSLSPENTLSAARKAYALGADLWELDVSLSRDGIPVVIHDDTLGRTSNVEEVFPERAIHPVYTFSLAELRRLDFGSWFNLIDPFGQIAAGAVSEQDQASFIGLSIPTLYEALQLTRTLNWYVNVEIKDMTGSTGDSEIVGKVLDEIESLGMQDRVLISSFNHEYLRQCRRLAPNVKLGALIEGNTAVDPVEIVRQAGADAFHPGADWLDENQIEICHKAGIPVNIWTVNQTVDMQRWIAAGANALFTDFPQWMTPLVNNARKAAA